MSIFKKISEIGLTLTLEDFKKEGERFKSFDENILPMELDNLKSSYNYILQKLSRKCNDAVKYSHLSEKLKDQINEEVRAIALLNSEAGLFNDRYSIELEKAISAANEVKDFDSKFFVRMQSLNQGPKDVVLALEAFLSLGPEGTQGLSDLSWEAIKNVINDKLNLYEKMINLAQDRVKDISRVEIDNATRFIKHLSAEFSFGESSKMDPFAKIIGNFVFACIDMWDIAEAAQARSELANLKNEKIEVLKREYNTYEEISNMYEKEIEEIYGKFKKSKSEYDAIKKEAEIADEALHKFEGHLTEMDKERHKVKKDVPRINKILEEIQNDHNNFETIRVRMNYKLPGDLEVP